MLSYLVCLYSRVNIKEYLSVVLSRHLCIAESTQRNRYLLSCLVCLYSRVNIKEYLSAVLSRLPV